MKKTTTKKCKPKRTVIDIGKLAKSDSRVDKTMKRMKY